MVTEWRLPPGGTGWLGYQAAAVAGNNSGPGDLTRRVVVGRRTADAVLLESSTSNLGDDDLVSLRTESGLAVEMQADGSLAVPFPGEGARRRRVRLKRVNFVHGTFALRYGDDRWVTAYSDGRVAASKASAPPATASARLEALEDDENTGKMLLRSHAGQEIGLARAPMWIPKPGVTAQINDLAYEDSARPDLDLDHAWDTGIVTYAGKDGLQYIDGAVMLGLSLQQMVPEYPRICMVVSTMAAENKQLLVAAGWAILEVDNWHARQDLNGVATTGPNSRFRDVFAKVNVFRINMRRILWMDADMLLYSARLRDVLTGDLPKGAIAMVKDCCGGEWGAFNSGLMFFEPSFSIFKEVSETMEAAIGFQALDQAAISAVYKGRIKELPPEFNTHKNLSTDNCSHAVVGHFTGPTKGSTASVTELEKIRRGIEAPWGVDCPDLYRDYYCRLKQHASFLSRKMQNTLEQLGPCLDGRSYGPPSTTTTTISWTTTTTVITRERTTDANRPTPTPTPAPATTDANVRTEAATATTTTTSTTTTTGGFTLVVAGNGDDHANDSAVDAEAGLAPNAQQQSQPRDDDENGKIVADVVGGTAGALGVAGIAGGLLAGLLPHPGTSTAATSTSTTTLTATSTQTSTITSTFSSAEALDSIGGSMTVENVDSAALANNPRLRGAFEAECQNTIALEAGTSAEHVQVTLSRGSVRVTYGIKLPPSESTKASSALTNAIGGELATHLVSALSTIPGIDDVKSGSMSVSSLSTPRVTAASRRHAQYQDIFVVCALASTGACVCLAALLALPRSLSTKRLKAIVGKVGESSELQLTLTTGPDTEREVDNRTCAAVPSLARDKLSWKEEDRAGLLQREPTEETRTEIVITERLVPSEGEESAVGDGEAHQPPPRKRGFLGRLRSKLKR
jgi:hypothetical protein